MNKKIFKKFIRKLPQNGKLLDIGCSDGSMIKIAKKYRPDLEFYGINITTKGYTVPNFVNFKISNVEDIEHQDNFFDAVMCFHVIEHVHHPFKARSEIYRVLKKGGLFLGEVPHWISMFTPIGFNFFDDPSHLRPYSVEGFKNLINVDNQYTVLYKKFDNPNFIYYPDLYEIKRNFGYFFRLFLKTFGLYRSASSVILRKSK